jgi:hypothetical protein
MKTKSEYRAGATASTSLRMCGGHATDEATTNGINNKREQQTCDAPSELII